MKYLKRLGGETWKDRIINTNIRESVKKKQIVEKKCKMIWISK